MRTYRVKYGLKYSFLDNTIWVEVKSFLEWGRELDTDLRTKFPFVKEMINELDRIYDQFANKNKRIFELTFLKNMVEIEEDHHHAGLRKFFHSVWSVLGTMIFQSLECIKFVLT